MSLPVHLGGAIGVPAHLAFYALVLALVAHAAANVRTTLDDRPLLRALVPAILVVHALATWVTGDFGQRDHLFLLGLLPWAARLAFRPDRPPTSLTLLAVALALVKPHFVAVLVAGFLGAAPWMTPAARWRVGGTLALSLLMYPAYLLTWPAESWSYVLGEYTTDVAPGLVAYMRPLPTVLAEVAPYLFVAAGSLGLLAAYTPRSTWVPWAATAAATAFAVIIQMKAWPYHLIPLVGLAATAGAAGAGLAWTSPVGWRRTTSLGLSLFGGGFLAYPLVLFVVVSRAPAPLYGHLGEILHAGDLVLCVDTGVWRCWNGRVEHGLGVAERYLPSFPVASEYRGAPPGAYRTMQKATRFERRFVEDLAHTVRERQPRAVLIANEGQCDGCPPGIEVHPLLLHNGFVATELAAYERQPDVAGMAVYLRK
jgi:hypothetical protein